ncbi:MAG: hypothetical protein JXI32_00815 [Deltaproteobacteria bacterium]|nr:hypothetical protein [Deltaproteobacteria bacterium]
MLQRWINPRLSYTVRKIASTSDGRVTLHDGMILESPKLARTVRGCSRLLCFIATIGPGIENVVQEMSRRHRLTDGYALDAIGSIMIEEVVETFQNMIREKTHMTGEKVTLRFSPGYCDWPVTEQKKLFALVDADRIDVTLTSSLLMSPRKSISGVFGVGTDIHTPSYNPCFHCRRDDCPARRE